ncbi:MAG: hypothetical protein R3F60_12155 [bacterium]
MCWPSPGPSAWKPSSKSLDPTELSRVLRLNAAIIGVNSRDLTTLAIDADRARRLLAEIPAGHVRVAESGPRRPGPA